MTNLITNGDFEATNYFDNWTFFDSGSGESKAEVAGANSTASAVRLTLAGGSNIQLYQSGLSVTSGVEYRLKFWGYSSGGENVKAVLRLHESPYTVLGLNDVVNLGTGWELHELVFTTTAAATNARLQMQINPYGGGGDQYFFDEFELDVNVPPPPLVGLRSGTRASIKIGINA